MDAQESEGGAPMTQTLSVDEVMEAFEKLGEEERDTLYALLRKRRSEANEKRLLAVAEEVRRDFADGKCKVMTAEEIVREIYS